MGLAAACFLPAPASAAPSSGADDTSVATFVTLDPIVLPLFVNNSPDGFLIVEIIIDTPSSRLAGTVKASMPRIRDGFIQTLSEYIHFEYRDGRTPNLDRLDQRLKTIVDWALGTDETTILFRHIMVQK